MSEFNSIYEQRGAAAAEGEENMGGGGKRIKKKNKSRKTKTKVLQKRKHKKTKRANIKYNASKKQTGGLVEQPNVLSSFNASLEEDLREHRAKQSDIEIQEHLDNMIILKIKNNPPTYMDGFEMPIGDSIHLKPNTIYMMSAYETIWPYAEKFLTIIRDSDGTYHLLNYNVFVGPDVDSKHLTNYVYQDTVPLVTPSEWRDIVKDFIKDKPDSILHDPQYRYIFEGPISDGVNNMLSFNQAFQLYRHLEITPDPGDVLAKTADDLFRNCASDGYKSNFKPSKDSVWDWDKWNSGFDIRPIFAEKQSDLIYTGTKYNIDLHGLKINLNDVKLMVGRIDAHYAGVISINICYPAKYDNFEKDMEKFKGDNKRERVTLTNGQFPNLLDIGQKFLVERESFQKPERFQRESFFDKKDTKFTDFIFSKLYGLHGIETNALIIGSNINGVSYAELLKEKAKAEADAARAGVPAEEGVKLKPRHSRVGFGSSSSRPSAEEPSFWRVGGGKRIKKKNKSRKTKTKVLQKRKHKKTLKKVNKKSRKSK